MEKISHIKIAIFVASTLDRGEKRPLRFCIKQKFVFLIKQYCVQSSQQNFESSEGTK